MSTLGLKLLICFAAAVCGQTEPNSVTAGPELAADSAKPIPARACLQQQIRSLQISAMETNSTLQADALKSMVDQIHLLKLPSETTEAEAVEPAKLAERPAAPAETKPATPEQAAPAACGLSVMDTVADPLDPLAAADALYRIGDYSRAMRFYEKIVDGKADTDVLLRQWAMYQAANCVRRQDADQAVAGYSRLLAEYPNSPWAQAAIIQKRNLEWFKKNEQELKRRTDAHAAQQ